MPNVNVWDVILIDFPYTDGTAVKKRPGAVFAVVLNDLGGEDVVIAAISSSGGAVGIQVPQSHPEFGTTGLFRDSRILPGKIFTCAKRDITMRLGKLGPGLTKELKNQLRRILPL